MGSRGHFSILHPQHLTHLWEEIKSVGQKDHNAVRRQLLKVSKHFFLCLTIQCGKRIIQNQYRTLMA